MLDNKLERVRTSYPIWLLNISFIPLSAELMIFPIFSFIFFWSDIGQSCGSTKLTNVVVHVGAYVGHYPSWFKNTIMDLYVVINLDITAIEIKLFKLVSQ